MNAKPLRQTVIAILMVSAFAAAGILLLGGSGVAQQGHSFAGHQKAHAVFVQKCLDCHVSVADPEKPGRTRDDWHLVVNVMHGYGLQMTDRESAMIVDLLYSLRKGMEREAG
jgi:hypothetical protein